jgi:MoaA/NifB/PqqE/SkfB family radical SAM enzyme
MSPSPLEVVKRRATLATHHIYTLPVLVLMPHSSCNCRCVMCDIWLANRNGTQLSAADLEPHLAGLRTLNVQRVVLSGGEALLHSNLWALCALLKQRPVKITLLSTGLLLAKHAAEVVRWCDGVIVSLDGSQDVHDEIRRIPNAYARLAEGVATLKQARPGFRVTGRCVVQRRNFRDLPNVIAAAHTIGLDGISFLAVDVSSSAFNRPDGWDAERVADVAPSRAEAAELASIAERAITDCAADFASGYVAEAPDKLRRIPRYFAALYGDGEFPTTVCNAPWVSSVVEADGTVRPCFFHPPLGNIKQRPLAEILNAPASVQFRKELDVTRDPTCRACVCTLSVGARASV